MSSEGPPIPGNSLVPIIDRQPGGPYSTESPFGQIVAGFEGEAPHPLGVDETNAYDRSSSTDLAVPIAAEVNRTADQSGDIIDAEIIEPATPEVSGLPAPVRLGALAVHNANVSRLRAHASRGGSSAIARRPSSGSTALARRRGGGGGLVPIHPRRTPTLLPHIDRTRRLRSPYGPGTAYHPIDPRRPAILNPDDPANFYPGASEAMPRTEYNVKGVPRFSTAVDRHDGVDDMGAHHWSHMTRRQKLRHWIHHKVTDAWVPGGVFDHHGMGNREGDRRADFVTVGPAGLRKLRDDRTGARRRDHIYQAPRRLNNS
jgi:hypothetical protein